MSEPLRIVQLNLAYDGAWSSPTELLAAYRTLTGWSTAISLAGAAVQTFQRFSSDARLSDGDVQYHFVAAGRPGTPDPWETFDGVVAAVAGARPDVVHINGLIFPGMLESLRETLHSSTAIVLQDHSGALPRRSPWPFRSRRRDRWQHAFAGADACTFTAMALAERWYPHGLPRTMPIVEILEASTHIGRLDRTQASRETGMDASPAILWVGRLDDNKDPWTALEALERALPHLPSARCWIVYHEGELENEVRRHVARSAALCNRVVLIGALTHDRLRAFYSASDIFLSASHHEGSGYALIEAMACGVSPCVTDIPAFRAIIGDCGARWPVCDASGCANALLQLASRDRDAERTAIRRRFDETLSWSVIARKTVSEYRKLVATRRQP